MVRPFSIFADFQFRQAGQMHCCHWNDRPSLQHNNRTLLHCREMAAINVRDIVGDLIC